MFGSSANFKLVTSLRCPTLAVAYTEYARMTNASGRNSKRGKRASGPGSDAAEHVLPGRPAMLSSRPTSDVCIRACLSRALASGYARVERSKAVHRRTPPGFSFLDLCLARAYPALLISFLDLSLAALSVRLAGRPPASAWPSCALLVESAGWGSAR